MRYLFDTQALVFYFEGDSKRLDSFERESYQKDPFDRLLVAQCIEENITMLTSDTKIPLYKKYGLEYLQYELD